MRKLSISLLSFLLFISCQKNGSSPEPEAKAALQQINQRSCASQEVLEARIKADPSIGERLKQLEEFTRRAIASGQALRGDGKAIEIPVVVHVLYNLPSENISDAQIQSQIDVLNEDFNLKNADSRLVPSIFSDRKADIGAKFTLAQTIRKYTKQPAWQPNDGMKYASRGGSDAIDPAHYLNIWVCNLGQNLLGYAQFPGYSPATDGVVILYSAFGRTGTLIQKYDQGRTATHEVGHWMNLRHIWGDATCGNDFVGDTPLHTTANFNCPEFPHYNTCSDGAVEMTMNYMDYTADACMYMFSNGQKSRMLAVFANGGPRAAFVQ